MDTSVSKLSSPAGRKRRKVIPDRSVASALVRGIKILSCFRIGDRPLGNAEIAMRTDLPKATVSRLTNTLAELGCLHHDDDSGCYELGGALVTLGRVASSNIQLMKLAAPELQRIAERTGLHVGIGGLDRNRMMYFEAYQGPNLVVLNLPVGSRLPVLTTPMGWAYLSMLSDMERERLVGRLMPDEPAERRRIVSAIGAALDQIQANGYCLSTGEWEQQSQGAAAPMMLGNNRYVIAAAGPTQTNRRNWNEIGVELADMAQKILRASGAPPNQDSDR